MIRDLVYAQRDNPYLLAMNLRAMLAGDETPGAIAASQAVAEALIIYRKQNTKG